MIDAQPTGGYPVVAVVIGADLPRLGQLAPGDPVTFELVDLPAAQRALALRQEVFHAAVAQLREAARWDELSSSAGG
jgi:allophanate hydrolase subunit 2